MNSEDKMRLMESNDGELNEPLVFDDGIKGQAKRHWANHRCAIISGACGFTSLIIILIIVFVGGANFAQSAVGSTDIKIQEMIITSFDDCPKGYENKCFKANLKNSIDNRSPMGAQMHAATIDLKFNKKKFGTLNLPSMQLGAAATTSFSFEDEVALITDPDVMTEFGSALMNQKDLSMTMAGKVKITAMGLSFNVNLEKDVALKGVDKFQDPPAVVTDNFIIGSSKNSIQLGLKANITNPSTTGFTDIGQLQLLVKYKGVVVGVAKTKTKHQGMAIGVNSMEFVASLDRTPENYDTVAEVLSSFTQAGDTIVTMHGFENTTSVKVLQGAMKNLQISNPINGLATLQAHGFDTGKVNMPIDTSSVNLAAPDATAQTPEQEQNQQLMAELSQYKESRDTCALPQMLQYAYGVVNWPQVAVNHSTCDWATPATFCLNENCSKTEENSANGMTAPLQALMFNAMSLPVHIIELNATVKYTPNDDPTAGYCDPTMHPYSTNQATDDNMTTHRYGCISEPIVFGVMKIKGTIEKPLLVMKPYRYTAWTQNLCVTAGFDPVIGGGTAEVSPLQFLTNFIGTSGYVNNKHYPGVPAATYGKLPMLCNPYKYPIPLPTSIEGSARVLIGDDPDNAFDVIVQLKEENVPGAVVLAISESMAPFCP
jgi:hypothetical protein